MTAPPAMWLIVTDRRRARLFQVGQTALGAPRLEEHPGLETRWVPSEHHRPSPLSARGVQSYGSREKEDLEEQRHRARQVARWIEETVERLRPEHLKIVAPPRFVDDLRRELRTPLDFTVAELANLSHGELARHPVVEKWLHDGGVPR